MPGALRFTFLIVLVLIQGCQHAENNENETNKKTDLSKAATYNVQLGLGYLKQGDRPRAKRKLLTAMEQEPESADVNAAMAYYFEQTSELEEAKKYYLKAIALSSNSGAQFNNYGTFLCRQGEYKKAESYFLKAVKDVKYVHTSGAYENAGLCALEVPDIEKARLYFSKALNQDPSRRESLYELAKMESKMGNDGKALELLQQHPDLVLNDRVFLSFAKSVAEKAGNQVLVAEYENSFKKMEPTTDISGVNNEYNNHIG